MKYLITFYIFLAILGSLGGVLNYQSEYVGGGYRTQRGPLSAITLNSIASNLVPDGNNTRDIGGFGNAWKDFYASGTLYIGSVTSTMIEPWANNISDLGQFGNAWKDVYVSGTLFADVVAAARAHIHRIITTTQDVFTINSPIAINWDEVTAEAKDWLVTDGVSSPTSTIPVDGTYEFKYCLEVEKTSGGGIQKFEMALFVDSVLEASSGAVQDFNTNNVDEIVCWFHLIESMTAGEEVTIHMAGESTALQISPTSTIFSGEDVSGGTLVITELDAD